MKLHLINRERLQALGSFLVDEFDNVIARVRAAWKVEHRDDGSHGNVHAQTTATGRLAFSDIATFAVPDNQVDNFDPPGLATAAMLRLDAAVTEVSITGIRVPQDEGGAVLDGRVLVLENASSSSVFVLEAENTFSAPRNRISTPWGAPVDDASPLRFYLRPSSLVTLIYNATKARWVLHGQEKDANVKYNSFAASQHDNVAMNAAHRVATWRVEFEDVGGSISGFVGTDIPETTRLTLVNVGLYKFSILHQNTSSSDGNRVQCPGSVQYVLNPRESVDLYRTSTGWRIVEKADQWIDIDHSAGDYLASSGNWTVDSADLDTLAYQLDGNKMTVSFKIVDTDVSSTPTVLTFPIPAGRTAARDMRNAITITDAGTAGVFGQAEVLAGGTVVRLFKASGAAFSTTSSDNTSLIGQITFMVRDDCGSISEDHTDVVHGDAGHADADHSDVSHVDVSHVDTHADTSHQDSAHGDVAHTDSHSDVAHQDVAFNDEAHEDSGHSDSHGDTPHSDSPGGHEDTAHEDQHNDHTDSAHVDEHFDVTHIDNTIEHGDISHEDAHGDIAHEDSAHEDVAHSDVAHSDSHSDVAHSDGGHVDTPHSDSHTDSPHSDTAHLDQGHGDTPHADSAHQDVGFHCDTSHSDI